MDFLMRFDGECASSVDTITVRTFLVDTNRLRQARLRHRVPIDKEKLCVHSLPLHLRHPFVVLRDRLLTLQRVAVEQLWRERKCEEWRA